MSRLKLTKLVRCFCFTPLLAVLCQCSGGGSQSLPPAPTVAPVQTVAKPTRPEFKPGDQLELFVKEDYTLNGNYLVREGGYIVIPRAGRVSVAGLTREEAEPVLRDFLLKTQLKEANVIVERYVGPGGGQAAGGTANADGITKKLVYLTGSVGRPGGHQIPVPAGKVVGVYEALLISGGLGKFAKPNQVEIFRFDASGKRRKTVIDLRPIINGTAEDPAIADGDIINIPEKVFGF